ncbi:MAG: hypothetical protein M3220_04235 [Chloroflexota bacterium]|nr:hypothetical protein [Chloroflexota bacterium]
MSTRPRKVETIVLGRGLAAAALADTLRQQGRRVALLVEAPGWEQGTRAAWRGWHRGSARAALAERGEVLLKEWQAVGLPGITFHDVGHELPVWLLDYGQLLPAIGECIAAGEDCWVAVGTRVRGISVIENAILGAIAEDSRYDARQAINAAEDERYAAFARMMRHPDKLDLVPVTPTDNLRLGIRDDGSSAWPGASPFVRDRSEVAIEETPVMGAWRVRGVAGWPLLALGATTRLTEQNRKNL